MSSHPESDIETAPAVKKAKSSKPLKDHSSQVIVVL